MSVLFAIPVDLAYHLVCWLAAILAPLPGGLAAAAAIVAFTVAVRLVLLPLSYYALRGERARAQLQPRVQELRRRYARQPERLQRELPALYRAEGTSMFAGCLPLLLQIPALQPDVPAVRVPLGGRRAEHPARAQPAGDATGQPVADRGRPVQRPRRGVRGLVRAAGRGGRAGRARRPADRAEAGSYHAPRPAPAAKEPAAVAGAADRAAGLLTRLMPFGSLVMAAIVPLAAGLYLLTTAAWTLAERAVLRRRLDHSAGG